MAYLEPEEYSEHCHTSTMESFAKNSYQVHFLVFRKMELSSLSELEKSKEPSHKKFLIFQEMESSSSKLKKLLFLGEPLTVFHHCFFKCFHFTIDFYYCWLHLFFSPTLGFFITCLCRGFYFTADYYCFSDAFISPTFFTVTVSCQALCFYVIVSWVLRIWESFFVFTLRHFSPYTPSPYLPQYRQCYRFERAFFILWCFFTLHSFPTFG